MSGRHGSVASPVVVASGPLRPGRLSPVALAELAALIRSPLSPGAAAVEVSGVTLNSAAVRPGDLFAALPGAKTHGITFARAAVAAGAVAVLTDPVGAGVLAATSTNEVAILLTANPRAEIGRVSAAVYGDPSRRLSVLGVTGTNGKTTTSYLLEAGLRSVGKGTGLIGTIETRIRTDDSTVAVPAQRTTPEAPELQATLASMAENGVSFVAMEVSSHALSLDRVAGTAFEVAGFTNFSQDHLDFHADLEDYFAAKARLFDGRAAHEVVVVDDEWGRRLVTRRTTTVSLTGDQRASWHAANLRTDAGLTSFVVHGPHGQPFPVTLALAGTFNVTNALLALAMLDRAGIDVRAAATGLHTARVPGRMELVETGQPFTALVDYAHTPAAVTGALAALRPQTKGRIILVLGCGGDRDRHKRQPMGAAAARGSDVLVVTDDNPRSEDPGEIRTAMRTGALSVSADQRGEVLEVGDRAEAIELAVGLAGPGDCLLVAGKGHEQGQEVTGHSTPFDDRHVLRRALAAHGWTDPPLVRGTDQDTRA